MRRIKNPLPHISLAPGNQWQQAASGDRVNVHNVAPPEAQDCRDSWEPTVQH